ncbi:YtxH domain-containing protein [Geoanaerobacter pelophilus]|uniref:YtxH domain-containing protein n=1 Tax=Geoanaerobacter pelophilus TaxID=60036 RepID=UPI000A2698E0|nr:YtxH domain-containing protein [Geoanaerobacter pelophilus]
MKRLVTDVMMLVGGGVVGAGLGLMFAPHSGAKSRKKMVRMGKMMSNKSDRMMRDLSDRVSDLADTMQGMSGKATRLMRIR